MHSFIVRVNFRKIYRLFFGLQSFDNFIYINDKRIFVYAHVFSTMYILHCTQFEAHRLIVNLFEWKFSKFWSIINDYASNVTMARIYTKWKHLSVDTKFDLIQNCVRNKTNSVTLSDEHIYLCTMHMMV